MSDRRKGYQHESNRTADLIEDYLDQYEKHTSTNRRLPKPSASQPSPSQKKSDPLKTGPSAAEKRSLYANAPKFDPRVDDVALKHKTNATTSTTKASPSTTIGTPRARSAESALRTASTPRKKKANTEQNS